MSFRRSLSTLKLIWCVIYEVIVTLISRDEKINTSAVWGPPEALGPGPLDKMALAISLRHIIWLPHESHAGMSLPSAVRRVQAFGYVKRV